MLLAERLELGIMGKNRRAEQVHHFKEKFLCACHACRGNPAREIVAFRTAFAAVLAIEQALD